MLLLGKYGHIGMRVIAAQLQILQRGVSSQREIAADQRSCRVRLGDERATWTSELGLSPALEGGISPGPGGACPASGVCRNL